MTSHRMNAGRAPRRPAFMRVATIAVVSILTAATLASGTQATADDTLVPSPSPSPTAVETAPSPAPTPDIVIPTAPPVGDGVEVPIPDEEPIDSSFGQGGGPSAKPSQADTPSDPSPITPSYSDDYLNKWEAVQAARNQLDAAKIMQADKEKSVDEALLGKQSAQVTLTSAQQAYTAALLAESEASKAFDATVRGMYTSGAGDMGQIVTVITSKPDDAIRNLESGYYLNAAAETNLNTYDDAKSASEIARDRRDAAQTAFDTAAAAYDAAVIDYQAATAALNDAQQAYDDAEQSYGSVVQITAPQTQIGPDGCPIASPVGTLRDGSDLIGVEKLCRKAVKQAATPQAAAAIKWAFTRLGAPYACKGVGRMDPFRFDCSSLVSRAYWEGAGVPIAGDSWAPSTRNMTPWDGVPLDPHLFAVDPIDIRPGDLVLYNTCPQGGCAYRHVVMYLGSPDGGNTYWMLHTNSCGDVAKVEQFWGFGADRNFEVVRRVMTLDGEKVTPAIFITPAEGPAKADKPAKPAPGNGS